MLYGCVLVCMNKEQHSEISIVKQKNDKRYHNLERYLKVYLIWIFPEMTKRSDVKTLEKEAKKFIPSKIYFAAKRN